MIGQAGHRESRSGKTQQVWKAKRWMNNCQEAPAGLWMTTTPFQDLLPASTRQLADSRSPRCRICPDVRPGPRVSTNDPVRSRSLHPRPAARRRGFPVGTGFPGGRQRRACGGRTRLRKWAEGWPPWQSAGAAGSPRLSPGPVFSGPRRPQPSPRPPASYGLGAEAMGKGGGRAIMKGKMVGGRARARPRYSPGPASAGSPSSWRRPGRPLCTRGAADAPSQPLPFLVVLGRREDAGRPPPAGRRTAPHSPRASSRADERPLRRGEAARRRLRQGVGGGRSRPGKSRPGSGGGEPPAVRRSPASGRAKVPAAVAAAAARAAYQRRVACLMPPPPASLPGSRAQRERRASRLLRIPPRAATANTILLLFSRALSIPPHPASRSPPLLRRPVNS